MLMQVGGVEGSRPTFFEMSAAQQLPASLRAALLYSMGVSSRCTYNIKQNEYDIKPSEVRTMSSEMRTI